MSKYMSNEWFSQHRIYISFLSAVITLILLGGAGCVSKKCGVAQEDLAAMRLKDYCQKRCSCLIQTRLCVRRGAPHSDQVHWPHQLCTRRPHGKSHWLPPRLSSISTDIRAIPHDSGTRDELTYEGDRGGGLPFKQLVLSPLILRKLKDGRHVLHVVANLNVQVDPSHKGPPVNLTASNTAYFTIVPANSLSVKLSSCPWFRNVDVA
jgi:hypothetical protein